VVNVRVCSSHGVGAEVPNGGPASLWQFVRWLVDAGETEGLTASHLWNLYLEFADYTDTTPLSKWHLFKTLPEVGVVKHRQGAGQRQWVYRIGPTAAQSVGDHPRVDVRAGRRR